jgi:hypothetical protein
MRKLLVVVVLLVFAGIYAVAQDVPATEIFGGYSFLHIDTGVSPLPSQIPAGFNADLTHYFAGPLGLTGDFQYHHKSYNNSIFDGTANLYSFHGGPRFKARSGKVQPFAHALFGFSHLGLSPAGGAGNGVNAFSMKLGAGLDLGGRHIAFRLAEGNFYYTRFPADKSLNGSDHQNNFTLSTGIVFRL